MSLPFSLLVLLAIKLVAHSKILVQARFYSVQHYVITFVSDLRQVGGFLRFPPPIKLTAMI
jgi:hypothetical protein